MTNYSEILERAKQGRVSREEIKETVSALGRSDPPIDRYTLLHIVGRSGDTSLRPMVEGFLESPGDPMLARLALQILCDYWASAELYREQLVEFVSGVPWDDENDVRLMAISVSGEYLRSHDDLPLAERLLRALEDESEDRGVREAAYLALARAVGRDWRELPSAARHFDLTRDVDASVLREVKRRMSAA